MVSLGKPLSQRLGVTCDLRVQNACLAGNRSCVRFIDCPLPRWEMLASAKMNHPEGACYLRCTLHAHFQHIDIWILQVSFQAPTHMFLPNLLLAEPGHDTKSPQGHFPARWRSLFANKVGVGFACKHSRFGT